MQAEFGRENYENPLTKRYASKEMSHIFSDAKKFQTWRKLWLGLATAQAELGLTSVSQEKLKELREAIELPIDYEFAEQKEKELRHDVMSHIHEVMRKAPEAGGIIHLGATSCFISDNTELIQIREAMSLVEKKLCVLAKHLADFAEKHKDLPTLGFTHYQPAQLTTVGKRACLWLQDFVMDLKEISRLAESLPFRGAKGTTGTQASYLALFDGDHSKVEQLDIQVAELMGFQETLPITGQTYTRKLDFKILAALSGIAQSAHKMGNDIRLLANLRELEEPFEKNQVGSSAMAYKRNPMRCERMCSLARFVCSQLANPMYTHSLQWLERTLDDSANRRLCIPESFLAVDALLSLAINVTSGLQVWPVVIQKRVEAELPFMATENILMAAVQRGGNRQELHEVIREHSMAAARRIKEEGLPNDLIQRIKADEKFNAIKDEIDGLLDPIKFVGRAPQQVLGYVEKVKAELQREEIHLSEHHDIRV